MAGVVAIADKGMEIMEREGMIEGDVEVIAQSKCSAMRKLGQDRGVIPFLQPIVGRFPQSSATAQPVVIGVCGCL